MWLYFFKVFLSYWSIQLVCFNSNLDCQGIDIIISSFIWSKDARGYIVSYSQFALRLFSQGLLWDRLRRNSPMTRRVQSLCWDFFKIYGSSWSHFNYKPCNSTFRFINENMPMHVIRSKHDNERLDKTRICFVKVLFKVLIS